MKNGTRLALGCLLVAVSCGGDDDAGDDTRDAVAGVQESLDVAPSNTADASDAPTPGRSACSLATDEQIGEIVTNPVTGIDIDARLCEYSLDSGVPGTDGTAVDVFVNEAFDEVCSVEFDVSGAADETAVDDIGSLAAWKPSIPTPQLFICTGSSFVTITQYRPSSVTDDEAFARAKAIADVVLGAL